MWLQACQKRQKENEVKKRKNIKLTDISKHPGEPMINLKATDLMPIPGEKVPEDVPAYKIGRAHV